MIIWMRSGAGQIEKEHFLADFFIGGFALTKSDTILTRDRGVYRKYFPDLRGYENCLIG